MVNSASSCGVKAARGTSLEQRFTQYWQLYTQRFVIKTFSSEMQRPSAEKVWQMPQSTVLPMPIPTGLWFPATEEVQATSYLAESVKMASFSIKSIKTAPLPGGRPQIRPPWLPAVPSPTAKRAGLYGKQAFYAALAFLPQVVFCKSSCNPLANYPA